MKTIYLMMFYPRRVRWVNKTLKVANSSAQIECETFNFPLDNQPFSTCCWHEFGRACGMHGCPPDIILQCLQDVASSRCCFVYQPGPTAAQPGVFQAGQLCAQPPHCPSLVTWCIWGTWQACAQAETHMHTTKLPWMCVSFPCTLTNYILV